MIVGLDLSKSMLKHANVVGQSLYLKVESKLKVLRMPDFVLEAAQTIANLGGMKMQSIIEL